MGPALAGLLSERTPVFALTVGAGVAVPAVTPALLLDRHPTSPPFRVGLDGRHIHSGRAF